MSTINGLKIDYNVTADTVRVQGSVNATLPVDPTYSTPTYGNIEFHDSGSLNQRVNIYLDEVEDMSTPGSYNPMLVIDQGLWVEKDIQTYGMLATNSDPHKGWGGGAIVIGHGLTGSMDPPKMVLTDAGWSTLYVYYSPNFSTIVPGNINLGNAIMNAAVLTGQTADPTSISDGKIWFRSNQ